MDGIDLSPVRALALDDDGSRAKATLYLGCRITRCSFCHRAGRIHRMSNTLAVKVWRSRDGGGFVVCTATQRYRTRSVLLAMGRRGTPRKLEVPGEESPKVVYRLIDPAQYDGQAVLVVGGGDSALEAAIALAERPGAKVTLSYRSEAFSRVKQKNRNALDEAVRCGRVRVELESTVRAIDPHSCIE